MTSDFRLLASQAVAAPFFDVALGIGPCEAGEDHTRRWFPVAVAEIVKLRKNWIAALLGQNGARRNAVIACKSRGANADHLSSVLITV